jgi:Uma2 family endonuclease
MNVALRRPQTKQEFLDWEDRQELRYEWDGVHATAMVGGTFAHSTIQANLIRVLGNALRGSPCRVQGSHLKIEVGESIRYPDAFVVCTPYANDAKVVDEPAAIFEILSPSSTHTDFVIKNGEYQATPSVQHYVVLEQTHAGAVVFSRSGQDWVSTAVRSKGSIDLAALGVTLPMEEIYEGLALLPDVATEM